MQRRAPFQQEDQLKDSVRTYFDVQSELYAERYLLPASGDVLWTRHDAILEEIRALSLPPTTQFLDIGCGPGLLSLDLAKLGYRGVGVDAAARMIRRCTDQARHQGISDLWRYQVGDAEALPLRHRSFDVAICAGVIEYLPTDDGLLREVARVLRPGGRFLLAVTNTYGYAVSLNALIHRVKQVPGAVKLASRLRRLVVGGEHGAMNFSFVPRKHRPAEIRRRLATHGFRIESDRFTQFALLPAPLCTLLPTFRWGIDRRLNVLDRTPLRILGSCYLLTARLNG